MAREPELSIKVKVDPVIKPDQLKNTIERKVKDSKEIPEIEIKPDEDKLVQNVQDALKDLEVPITPRIDATKLGNDLQKEINKIKELPSVKINVDVDNFSNTLNKKLKTELKEVNNKLNYYLKNLTTNTASLNSVVEGLFPNRGISNEVQHELKRIQTELTTGLKGTAEKIKPFKVTDLFQVDGKEGTATVRRVKQLVSELRKDISSFDENYNDGSGTLIDGFDDSFKKIQDKARETQNLLSVLKSNLNSEQFKKIFNDNTFDTFNDTQNFAPLIKKLGEISSATVSSGDDWGDLVNKLESGSEKGSQFIESFCDNAIEDLDSVSRRVSDIISEQKTAIEVVKEMTETLNKAIKDDASGYLSDAEIKTYGATFDEVLSNIASKQAAINDEREKGVGLENSIVAATRLTRNALSEELREYDALFKKYDTDKISKFAETTNLAQFIKNQEAKMQDTKPKVEESSIDNGIYNVTDVKFAIDPAVLQLKVDAAFKDISAPIGLHPRKEAIQNIKNELVATLQSIDVDIKNTPSVNTEAVSSNNVVELKGHVTIETDDIDTPNEAIALKGKIDIKPEDIHVPDTPVEVKTKVIDTENITSTNTTTSVSPTADNPKSEKIKLVKAATYNASIEAMDRYIQKMGDIGVSQELLIQWTDNLTRQLQEQKSIFKEVAEYAEKYIKAVELQNRKQGSKSGSDINGVVGVGQITSTSKQIGKLSTAVNNTENKELVAEFDTLQKSFDDFVSSGNRSLNTFSDIESAIGSLQQKVTDFKKAQNDLERNTTKVTEKTITSFNTMIKQVDSGMWSLKKRNKTDLPEYQEISDLSEQLHSLQVLMNKNIGADENEIVQEWAANYPDLAGKIKKLSEAYDILRQAATKAGISINDISNEAVQQNALIQSQTRIANLQSQLHDYLEKFPKIKNSSLADSVKKLQQALNSPNAYQQADKLGQKLANLKQKAKELGLESENLIDKFEKLFGTHFSTMITMAALHQMQNALRVVYQNVVEIDSAMTELRKVTNLTASGYEEFMDRAADQAQKLGISISDFINSTADWARLGYDEQDAEELARVSSLLKNVGDGIESASDASSYLISGMQGFGLAADQASEFLDVLNQIANTEPVTANNLGVIMQKSAAAMNAAGNTYQETMAMAAAVNGILQDDDVSGTYLKTLSMYLRAAKTDAEDAGIEIDGMASSVSELRSELKQLTGVDIMSDAAGKNFKSTYQIMKELSKVWGSLSDVTQANVTELISGKRGGQATSALLNNFSVAEDAMKQAANATGSALAENAKYLDSIQGRLAQLDTSFQSLSTHVLDSGIVKYAVSFLTTIIKITDNITKLSGALPPIAAAVSGILSVMQMNGKLENGAGKVNMPAYARCA